MIGNKYHHASEPCPVSAKSHHNRKKKLKHRSIYDYGHIQQTRDRVPIENYLIERELPTITREIESQTQSFLEIEIEDVLPKPRKTGVDRSTQIDTNLVFDYDTEVVPLIDIIVSKTIEQSVQELTHEEHIQSLINRRRVAEETVSKEVEAVEAIEMKELERMALFVKRKEKEQQRVAKETNEISDQALMLLMGLLSGQLEEECMDQLHTEGYFPENERVAVTDTFLPWLKLELTEEFSKKRLANQMANIILQNSIKLMMQAGDDDEVESHTSANESTTSTKLRLCVNGIESTNEDGESNGPFIEIFPDDTIAEVETKIMEWINENTEEEIQPPDGGFLQLAFEMDEEIRLEPDMTIAELDQTNISIPVHSLTT